MRGRGIFENPQRGCRIEEVGNHCPKEWTKLDFRFHDINVRIYPCKGYLIHDLSFTDYTIVYLRHKRKENRNNY